MNEGDGLKMRVDFEPPPDEEKDWQQWQQLPFATVMNDDTSPDHERTESNGGGGDMKGSIVIDVIVEAVFILGKFVISFFSW